MDTAEMRLLTVPQFARRVNRSVDEVLALIANRDIKALRPDPEGGYRVLETEVDRLLQEKFTRIKVPEKSEGAPRRNLSPLEPPTLVKVPVKSEPPKVAPTPPRSVAMEQHLTVVTALENAKADNARLERLNSTLQSELFQYRRMHEEVQDELLEARSRLEAAQQQLCAARLESIEVERRSVEIELASTRRLQAELEAAKQEEAEKVTRKRSFWQRLFS